MICTKQKCHQTNQPQTNRVVNGASNSVKELIRPQLHWVHCLVWFWETVNRWEASLSANRGGGSRVLVCDTNRPSAIGQSRSFQKSDKILLAVLRLVRCNPLVLGDRLPVLDDDAGYIFLHITNPWMEPRHVDQVRIKRSPFLEVFATWWTVPFSRTPFELPVHRKRRDGGRLFDLCVARIALVVDFCLHTTIDGGTHNKCGGIRYRWYVMAYQRPHLMW